MSKALLIALLVGAVVAMVVVGSFLLTGSGPLGGSSGDGEDDPGSGDLFDGDDPTTEVEAPGGPREAVLFGRAGVRVGKGSVLGRVADFASKDPVEGVTLHLSGTGYGQESVASSTESGADGRFHLAAVPAGEDYVLEVVAKDAVLRRVAGVSVPSGDVTDLDTIWLGDAGTLIGRVVSLEGGGLAGATVRVLSGGTSMQEMMQDFVGFVSKLDRDPVPLAEGVTDANGRFAIEGVPPGPITIVVRADGFHQQLRQAVMTKDGVIGEEPTFRMEPAEPITGRVISEDGRGVAGARIALMDSQSDDSGFHGRRFVETEGDGTFRIASPPQTSRLMAIVAAEGYPTLFAEIRDKREGLEFILAAGASIKLRFVTDDTSEPIPGASIVAMLSETEQLAEGGSLLTGVTDALGEVEFEARPGFVVMLFFAHPTLGSSMYGPQIGMGMGGLALKGPKKMEIVAGENRAELRKMPGVEVTGRVTNAKGEPVPGATVKMGSFFMLGGGGKVVTDDDGVYRLAVAAMQQTTIVIEAPGYVQDPASMTVALDPPNPAQHDVVLLTAARIEGKVVGPKGTPARGVAVQLVAERDPSSEGAFVFPGTSEISSQTDNAGRYVFETVAPDRKYHLVGQGEGFIATRSEAFEVRTVAGVVTAPRLILQTGLEVEVEVLDPSGGPVIRAGVDVHVDPTEPVERGGYSLWQAYQKLVTSASGRAKAKDVPPGKVTFTASATGFASSRASTTVSRASPPSRPVVVRLRPMAVVAGEIRDQHGEAVEGAQVSVNSMPIAVPGGQDDDESWVPSASDTTDARGHFDLKGLPAGAKLTLSVHLSGYRGKTFPIDGPTDRLQLQIHKIDPEAQRRMNEIQTELMGVYQRLQAAKDDTERQELQKQLQALSLEMQGLQQDGVDHADAVAVPEDE